MSVAGLKDVVLDQFGGLVTDMAPTNLPAGVSPDCPDVQFFPGRVRTRPGLYGNTFAAIAGNPTVNYLKTFVANNLSQNMLALDSLGSMWAELTSGVLTAIATGITPNSYCVSTTDFGREYFGISDGKFGIDIPRQWDLTNFDRVSQVGPGAGPSVTDANLSAMIASITQPASVSITSIISDTLDSIWVFDTATPHGLSPGDWITVAGTTNYNGNMFVLSVGSPTQFNLGTALFFASESAGTVSSSVSTVTLSTPLNLTNNLPITIAGAAVVGYNGAQFVKTVTSPTVFTFINFSGGGGLGPNGASGTIAFTSGNISAGVHQVVVMFQTRQGYITAPSPPVSWTAVGGFGASLTNIPIGPSNIVARILAFTLVGEDSFFTIGSDIVGATTMTIPDNTTTSFSVDFTDTDLAAAENVDNLFNLLELGECAWAQNYSSRLFWGCERTKLNNFLNLTFDGGWNLGGGTGGSDLPLGWTSDPANGIDGAKNSAAVVWGDAYQINSDAGAAVTGQIFQTAYQDFNGVGIIQPATGYSFRVRLRYGAGGPIAVGPSVFVQLQSASTGFTVRGGVNASLLTDTYQEFIGVIGTTDAVIPTDLQLTIYVNWINPVAGKNFLVDCLEIFPTDNPFNITQVRASYAFDPESFDSVTGIIGVGSDNAQAVRASFKLSSGLLYFVKERSMYVTQDDGVNEPDKWNVNQVSGTVGTPSVNGVDVGEDWAVIVNEEGLFIFTGSEPEKISQEIQPTWDQINWQAAQTVWVRVDIKRKRVYIGVPMNGATSPNKVLMLDYRSLATPGDMAPVSFSQFTGKILAHGAGRKWSIWNMVENSGALILRTDGTQHFFFGNGSSTGKIYDLLDSQLSDDGVPINGYYDTCFMPTTEQRQESQMNQSRVRCGYLQMNMEGVGQLNVQTFLNDTSFARPIPPRPLEIISQGDLEITIDQKSNRLAFQVGTNAVGSWFQLSTFVAWMEQDPSSPVRGTAP